MLTVLWLVLAWVGGIAAILGSLMTVASFLLWLVPTNPTAWKDAWKGRMAILGVAVGLTIVGLALLWVVPFPNS